MGMPTREAALEGTRAVVLPVLASTLTTMAVLLPVLLLAGLAKKLFAPLALTVAVAMSASYFVSVCVTPVLCRFLLGHTEHGRFGKAVEAMIDGVAERYAGALRAVLPFRWTIVGACAVLTIWAAWVSVRLPSTFFPEIDESMERVYVRLAPGVSLEEASRKIQEMGKTLSAELPKGNVELVLTNVGSPNNARSAMTSPNSGPHQGFIRLALVDAENRSLSQRELADMSREILTRAYPGVDFLQWPGGLVASVFSNGYIAPLVAEVRGDNLAELDAQARAVAEIARTVPGVRDVRVSFENDYPEVRVDTQRDEAGLVASPRARRLRRRSRPRSATSTRRAYGSTRTTGNRTTP
jgi:multidrug efflux pump subunit AcrB